jgi:hypothetical protein
MHIYIDESGRFVPRGSTESRVSGIGALIVPSASIVDFEKDVREWKRNTRGHDAEIKGSSLTEVEASSFIALVSKHDVLFEACLIDAASHEPNDVAAFRAKQAAIIRGLLPADPLPSLEHEVSELTSRLERLSEQLFVQWFTTIVSFPRILEHALTYYCQRSPRELGSFAWRIDAKDRKITAMEQSWQELVGPLLQNLTSSAPLGAVEWGDYSYLRAFELTGPEADEILASLPPEQRAVAAPPLDTRALFADLQFQRSHDSLGIQAADMLLSILTRAFNATLREDGWSELGKLIIKRNPQSVRFIALNGAAAAPFESKVVASPFAHILGRLRECGKVMPHEPPAGFMSQRFV